jgi:hypothetical protein
MSNNADTEHKLSTRERLMDAVRSAFRYGLEELRDDLSEGDSPSMVSFLAEEQASFLCEFWGLTGIDGVAETLAYEIRNAYSRRANLDEILSEIEG